MPSFYPSSNMNLPIPVVGIDTGPNWAININSSLTLVDSHDHSAGKGVQITPAGILINSTLEINNQDLIYVRSTRFYPQISVSNPSDLGCLYVSGSDLFYNDVNGNQIQITQSGGVAGTPGSIGSLVAPASASYVAANDTFVWQSGVSQAANMDMRSAILRNSTAGSFGMTVNPPSAMTGNFGITFPLLPASTSYLTMNTSGNILHANPPVLKTQTFTASGIFTVPANVTQVIVFGCGGGGGGGGPSGGYGGSGGGGAQQSIYTATVVPGTSQSVIVGTGGAGGVVGNVGNDGAASIFASYTFRGAPGGGITGGAAAVNLAFTSGGAGTNSTSSNTGGANPSWLGGLGGLSGTGRGGGGGAGAYGPGAFGGGQNANGSNAFANTGAGGGGAGAGVTTGGNGADGQVTVCWVE